MAEQDERRNALLTAHVGVCVLTEFGHACGGKTGWYCDEALEIIKMGESCCHTHDIMDVAAAVVTPGVDVDRLRKQNQELLEALEAVMADIGAEEHSFRCSVDVIHGSPCVCGRVKARAAIEKAKS